MLLNSCESRQELQAPFTTPFKVFLMSSQINSNLGLVEEKLPILVTQALKLIIFLMLGHVKVVVQLLSGSQMRAMKQRTNGLNC